MSANPPRLLATMAAHLPVPRLPVLLFVFLAVHVHVHVPASHAIPPSLLTTYDGSICSESFKCGGVNIRYPFYLADATREIADYGYNYSCGYTDLLISCQGEAPTGIPFITLGGDNYTVQNIFYDTHTIILVDSDVLVGGSCPAVRHNVSFNETWLHNSSAFDNLTFFFGCHLGDYMTLEFDAYKIKCADFKSPPDAGPGDSFVVMTDEHDRYPEPELPMHCNMIVTVPVNHDVLMVASNQQDFRSSGYGDVLKRGFELEWERVAADGCHQCEESNGRCAYSQHRDFLGCLCHGGKVGSPDCKRSRSKGKTAIIVGIVAGTLFLCLGILIFFSARKYAWLPLKSKDEPRIESFLQKNRNIHPKRYTYANVKRMTKSFDVKLGQGGFGAVYRGNLHDGRQVAVKMLKDTKGDGEEFMNEVASISRTSHINVVTLLGFCLQGSKRALIYEYMPNGSLERYAFNRNMNSENLLSWEKLFDIAIGTARGLEYLHRGCNTRIVHFDIKPHNILLDQDFCPKISDFGLAKLCLNKESAISIAGARGTIGYIAPEVYSKQFGLVSSKSDVYSYGMMVLEMVGARDKNTSENSESSSQYFPQWIYEHLDDYCISASEIDGETTELVRKMIVVGLWCIQVIPTDRPTMTRVVEMLEGSTSNLELPPKVLLSSQA
ncbi:LEAF RUST 10 DISEASE-RESISTANCEUS RECEPTOR-LIKE PROTEIN KINASE-like 2.1 isoform X1 [Miscanthus floridulus]|uniref:LEAF RUST 10 DISEASE-RESISTANCEUS RECEPTOR-LIKE PROTEIN KINASE-like 2.1 isoform X1 n=1 Tax=Miscanthus floridulus TaxID=154761 RepID=UPI00345A8EA6